MNQEVVKIEVVVIATLLGVQRYWARLMAKGIGRKADFLERSQEGLIQIQ